MTEQPKSRGTQESREPLPDGQSPASPPANPERRTAVQEKLASLDPALAETKCGPVTKQYYDAHGPCDRPPALAWLCVRVGLATLPVVRPTFDGEAVADALGLDAPLGPERTRQGEAALGDIEARWNAYWLDLARAVDAWLGLSGCGPHNWAPSAGGIGHVPAPFVDEQQASLRPIQETNGAGTRLASGEGDAYGIKSLSKKASGGLR